MKKTWTALAGNFSALRGLVIGDIMLDKWIEGESTRLSPEAPVPVITRTHTRHTAGGAANVACNLAALGITTSIIGSAGKDMDGAALMSCLDMAGVDTKRCVVANGPTISKTRVCVQRQQVCRLDTEAASSAYALVSNPFTEQSVIEMVSWADFIIISDYAKGSVTQGVVDIVRQIAAPYAITADPKPASGINWSCLGALTPNRHEALQLAGIKADPDKCYPIDEVCAKLHSLYAPDCLCVTLGEDGVVVSWAKGTERLLLPSTVKDPCDVTGAGDTFTAVFAAVLATSVHPMQAAEYANVAAGLAVSKRGTAVVSIDDLRKHAGN